MAFMRMSEYQANLFEKSCASFIKVGDLRWQDYGSDGKKTTKGDNTVMGPVAYVELPNKDDDDVIVRETGNVVKIFFNCLGSNAAQRYAMIEVTENVVNARQTSAEWVGSAAGATVVSIKALCPAAA